MSVHVCIERRQLKPSQLYRVAVLIFFNDDIGAGFLIFELNFIPHQFDVFPARRIGGICGNDEQPDTCPFLSADHFNHFVQSHLANIDIIRRPLRHSSNPVAHFKSPVRLRRTARHEAFDFRVAIFRPEHGADAYERQAHVNTEILHIGLAQVFRMRVVRLCKRIEKEFDLLVLVLLVHVAGEAIVTARNELRCGLNRMLAQMLLQQLVCDTTAPELVGFRFIFWPRRFLATQLDRRIALEINRLLQQLFYLGDPSINSFGVQRVDVVSRLQRAEKNVSCDRVAVFCIERVNVLLRKEKVTEIEQL